MQDSWSNRNSYTILGLMSGTSLDGMDLALCKFERKNEKWDFRIIKAETTPYNSDWEKKLREAYFLNNDEIKSLDREYGQFLGTIIYQFLENYPGVDFISSHGHTIFHKPEKGITVQIGNGDEIAKICKKPVIYDFRTKDVSLGGQGAPLVPVGDRELFGEYDACLNLGGFSNISFEKDKERIAFDICPVNIILNLYSSKLGYEFDENGNLGRKGKIITSLLDILDSLPYYKKKGPASLGYEWLESEFLPVLANNSYKNEDVLRTLYEHISNQISGIVNSNNLKSTLITGGGAFNSFLIERIKNQTDTNIVIPDEILVSFKEALIFAFLGLLRLRNEINCLASVTGALKNNIGGKIANIIN